MVDELEFSLSLDFFERCITASFIGICRTSFALLIGGVLGSPLTLDPSNATSSFSVDFVPDFKRGVVGALTEWELFVVVFCFFSWVFSVLESDWFLPSILSNLAFTASYSSADVIGFFDVGFIFYSRLKIRKR